MDAPQSDLQVIRRLLADLTTRVYRIERQLGIQSEANQASVEPSPATPTTAALSSQVPPLASRPVLTTPSTTPTPLPSRSSIAETDLESRIASHWFNRIGIAAVLIGISYFLKFAFDNNWIGPAGRVAIGLLAGIAVVVWSDRFRARSYTAFSFSLKAVGIGTLYLSLWAAFQVYHLVGSGVAFVMML